MTFFLPFKDFEDDTIIVGNALQNLASTPQSLLTPPGEDEAIIVCSIFIQRISEKNKPKLPFLFYCQERQPIVSITLDGDDIFFFQPERQKLFPGKSFLVRVTDKEKLKLADGEIFIRVVSQFISV